MIGTEAEDAGGRGGSGGSGGGRSALRGVVDVDGILRSSGDPLSRRRRS